MTSAGLKSRPGSHHFHVMAKPNSSTCNLDCTYCFYLSKERLPGGPGAGRMDDAALERFIAQYIAASHGKEVVFSWQGGEPTMAGLAFFHRVVALQEKYARPGQRIVNDLQTNGVLLDREWATFLKARHFLVGLSIDGPRELHDRMRINKGGAPTFDKVMSAVELLRSHGIPFNTLTCVHRWNAARPLDVYRFLRREINSTYMQFIPIVQWKGFEKEAPQTWNPERMPVVGSPEAKPGHEASVVTEWSVDPETYGYFLIRVFDEWRRKDIGRVMVTQFETLVAQHLGLPAQICVFSETCGRGIAVEHDLSVYSCDHYVYPEHRLGSLKDRGLSDIVFSEEQRQFGEAKSRTLPTYCRECPYLSDCWGECPKNRFIRTPTGEAGLNYLCLGLKKFFKAVIPEIDRIADTLRSRR